MECKDEVKEMVKENSLKQHKVDPTLFSFIVESSPNGIFALESIKNDSGEICDFSILFCNRALIEILGINQAECIGELFFEIFPHQVSERMFPLYVEVCATEGNHRRIATSFIYGGEERWLQQDLFWREGGLAVICSEITHLKRSELEFRKAKELAESASKSKTEFLATVSHETRTPINAILGFGELLSESDLEIEDHECVNHILKSGRTLLALINEILDLAKIDCESFHIEQTTFAIIPLIEDSLATIFPKAQKKGVNIRLEASSNIPKEVISDPLRLTQILNNLLSNAVKFTDEGEIVVSVQKTKNEEESSSLLTLLISVQDSGIGISQEEIKKLFQPFSQLDSSLSRKYEGTGLGLYLSKRICGLLGGDMWLESVESQGSTFYFSIATQLPKKKETAKKKLLGEGSFCPVVRKRILLAEDVEMNQVLAVRQLNKIGNSWIQRYIRTLLSNFSFTKGEKMLGLAKK